MKRFIGILFGILALCCFGGLADAQTIGCPYPLQYGQVLTAAQWNACISAGLNALPLSGGTLSGPLGTSTSTTAGAGLNIPYGSAPTTPNPGDVYNLSSGLSIYDNGAWNLIVGTQTASPAQGDILYFNGTKWLDLAPGTSGYFLETLGPGADPQWSTAAGGSGCTISGGSQYQIIVNNGSSGCSSSASASANGGTLTLGASGTLGNVKLGNATSGTVTIQPTTGALGTVTASLPANTGPIAETNLAQNWTALQTVANGDLGILGSSTGYTALASANSGPSNYTITLPAIDDTAVTLTAGQTLTNKTISGSSNTLTNIANGSLTNSSMTIAGHSVSLGGSQSIACGDLSNAAISCSSAPTYHNQQFLTSGTFTAPSGTTTSTVFKFIVTAGGGSATGSTNYTGGGAGATAIYYASGLTAGDTVAVTVGAAGVPGSNGGNSVIVVGSTTVTATGGGSNSLGGTATNGTVNIGGGDGASSPTPGTQCPGGASFWGGSNSLTYGSGGSYEVGHHYAGPGIVTVEWVL